MPIRHGLTIGELAQLFNGERKIGAKLSVVRMPRWRRDWWFDDTGAPWINPSPNMRSLTQATLYPGIGAIEASNISVGRGTDTPFERIGAPWIDGLAARRGAERPRHPGRARLSDPLHAGVQRLRQPGVRRRRVHRHRSRGAAADAPRHRDRRGAGRASILGTTASSPTIAWLDRGRRRRACSAGDDPAAIVAAWAADEAKWRLLRAKYLIYTPE